MRRCLALAASLLLAAPAIARADQEITLDGDAPDDALDHFFLPFQVPAGTKEVEVRHESLSDGNILDWGLSDTEGFRGWGGGNKEPAIVGERAASRSYLVRAVTPGEWQVVVGKALIKTKPAAYHVKIILREAPTLAAQPERSPYVPSPALSAGPRWYAGDLHVHSHDSGDASPSLDEIAAFARGRGLDFVEISDHNTVSQLDFFVDAQARHPDLLFVPGIEFTTYAGHANAVGATAWVDHKIGQPGVTIDAAAEQIAAQGALLSINHPAFELGDACIGCSWRHDLSAAKIQAVEVSTGSVLRAGLLFGTQTFAYWEKLLSTGQHVAAIGGSDDHRAGQSQGLTDSPIGSPLTLVHAAELSTPAILAAIRGGKTVVKMHGPEDPMVELASSVAPAGDTIEASVTTLRATITGAAGESARFVRNGEPLEEITIDASPFVLEATFSAPASGEDRVRAEALVKGKARTVTSHLFLRAAAAEPASDAAAAEPEASSGCGCEVAGRGRRDGPWLVLLSALALVHRRRRRSEDWSMEAPQREEPEAASTPGPGGRSRFGQAARLASRRCPRPCRAARSRCCSSSWPRRRRAGSRR
jgi:hypothetical protein